ncbi:MAG: tetratricopeptide repeat protein [Acidobacteria bacterium]|nr:tetratricopeptide repeat protein [Acidobacteriota bacterium]
MPDQRLEVLTQLLEKNPKNSFARYGLAMEYVGQEQYKQAMEQFEKLWEADPDYAAAYYQAGQVLVKTGDIEQARRIFQKGIEVTARLGDFHAQSELQSALEQLQGSA